MKKNKYSIRKEKTKKPRNNSSILIKPFKKLGISILKLFYEMMKDMPVKDRVVFMSNQANEPTLDIRMLMAELEKRNIRTAALCKKREKGFAGSMKYLAELHKQMRYLATSKVVILDSNNMTINMFERKEETKVIQMWHALGAFRKFGCEISDKKANGYDYIFASSKATRAMFAEAFGCPEDKISIMSLPRVDAILDPNRNLEMAKKIKERYSELTAKKTIYYVPTYHPGEDVTDRIERIIYTADTSVYNLIIKLHPMTEYKVEEYYPINVVVDTEFDAADLLSVADFVITDYSAFTYEAALKGLPIYFYAYDKEFFTEDGELFLDYDNEMPGPVYRKITEVIDDIESGKNTSTYKMRSSHFANKYIEKRNNCTEGMAKFIEELL